MNKTRKLVTLALAGVAMAALGSSALAETHKKGSKVKCYGVAKAGKNDCATGKTACAGSSKMDSQGDAYVVMPKGICEKLAGSGADKPVKDDSMK